MAAGNGDLASLVELVVERGVVWLSRRAAGRSEDDLWR